MSLFSPSSNAADRLTGRAGSRMVLARALRRGLETHISLPLFAVMLLAAMWTLTFHFIANERDSANQAALDAVHEMGDTYEAQLSRNLSSIDQSLKILKFAVQTRGASGALQSLSSKGLLPSGLLFVVSIADRDGQIVASNPPAAHISVAGEPYFEFHRSGRTDGGASATAPGTAPGTAPATASATAPGTAPDTAYVSRVLRDPANPEPHLHLTRRLDDANGHFAGVAIVEADPAYFTSGYERSRQGDKGQVAMVGDDGIVRALRQGDTFSWDQPLRLEPVERPLAATISPIDGKQRYTAVRPVSGFPVSAMVSLDRDEQMAPFERQRRTVLWAAGSVSVLLVALVTLVCVWSWQLSRSQHRIRRAQATFAAAAEASLDAFFVMKSVIDDDGAIVDFEIEATNGRAETITGLPLAVLEGGRVLQLMPSYRDNGIFDDMIRATLFGGIHEAEWRGTTAATRDTWMHRQVVAIEGGVVAIVRDITERKRAEARIAHMAHHDALTGLPNRSLLGDRLDQAILHAQRKRRCVAVAFIDLDGFKLVNDGLGHNAGDALLKVVGERMQGCLRSDDTLGRFGGDEFVVILSDLDDHPMGVTPVLEKIRQAVREPVQVEGQQVQVSCSMGVVMYPRDGVDPTTLMMNADAAMYRAKELGSNNFQFYTSEMNASVEEKLVLLDGLRQALAGDQFRLVYQPKVDLRSGRIFGVEALLRWHHPEQGMISPLRFIGLAEESGLIVAIGDWVLRTACRQAMAWRGAGLPPLSVSVNVSPRQFEERALVARVAGALADSGLDAAALELEVTESLIMRDLAQSVGKMGELKAMGVALSIDDFGTGYSSLASLKSFPISSLKIDKSFIGDLADSLDDQAIAMAVISLGHKLNLRVIAEGVETEEQKRFLRENDCDEMQGYLFSPPVPPAAIAALLLAQQQALAPQAAAPLRGVAPALA